MGPARVAGIGVDDVLVRGWSPTPAAARRCRCWRTRWSSWPRAWGAAGGCRRSGTTAIGGVSGALSGQADAAWPTRARRWPQPRRGGRGLLRLVTVDEDGRPTRWRVASAELPEPVRAELAAFVGRRLLTTDETWTAWSVARWRTRRSCGVATAGRRDRERPGVALRARREVEHAAAEWAATGRARRRLWRGGPARRRAGEPRRRLPGRQSERPLAWLTRRVPRGRTDRPRRLPRGSSCTRAAATTRRLRGSRSPSCPGCSRSPSSRRVSPS